MEFSLAMPTIRPRLPSSSRAFTVGIIRAHLSRSSLAGAAGHYYVLSILPGYLVFVPAAGRVISSSDRGNDGPPETPLLRAPRCDAWHGRIATRGELCDGVPDRCRAA